MGASKGSVGVVGVRNGHQSVARRPCGSPSGSPRQFRVVGSVARVSRPRNMSVTVGVPNVHVKVYNMLIPHNDPNVCAEQHTCYKTGFPSGSGILIMMLPHLGRGSRHRHSYSPTLHNTVTPVPTPLYSTLPFPLPSGYAALLPWMYLCLMQCHLNRVPGPPSGVTCQCLGSPASSGSVPVDAAACWAFRDTGARNRS